MLSFISATEEFLNASEYEVVNHCCTVAGGCVSGTMRVATDVFLKRSLDSAYHEYQNQLYVWELCDARLLRVAKPLRWFEHVDSKGLVWSYFLMEYLSGTTIETYIHTDSHQTQRETGELVSKIFDALRHLHTVSCDKCTRPGPVSGAKPCGFPWGDYGLPCTMHRPQDLEALLYRILEIGGKQEVPNLVLGRLQLVHGDLAARNIMILDNGSIAIVDWVTLSYYPPVFEIASLFNARNLTPSVEEGKLLTRLVEMMEVSEDDESVYWVSQVQAICLRTSMHGVYF